MSNIKKITVPTPQTQPARHVDVVRAIRACCLATSQLAPLKIEHRGCSKETRDQERRYNALFHLLFQRFPTPAELYYLIGGSVSTCTECNRDIPPNANGTANDTCPCRDEEENL